jgi:hypothetical protein
MKITTIALATFFALGSTLAIAQGAGGAGGAGAGGAGGAGAGAGGAGTGGAGTGGTGSSAGGPQNTSGSGMTKGMAPTKHKKTTKKM